MTGPSLRPACAPSLPQPRPRNVAATAILEILDRAAASAPSAATWRCGGPFAAGTSHEAHKARPAAMTARQSLTEALSFGGPHFGLLCAHECSGSPAGFRWGSGAHRNVRLVVYRSYTARAQPYPEGRRGVRRPAPCWADRGSQVDKGAAREYFTYAESVRETCVIIRPRWTMGPLLGLTGQALRDDRKPFLLLREGDVRLSL
jgi:hypothetical protein